MIQLFFCQGEQVATFEKHFTAFHTSLPVEQPKQRKRRNAFSAAGLPHNAKNFPRANLEMHILCTPGQLFAAGKGNVQVTYFQ